MERFGRTPGLKLFVLLANLTIYMMLSLDSRLAKFPSKLELTVEILVDRLIAWFLAGLHFGGGTSWFWPSSDMVRQTLGTILYLTTTLIWFGPRRLNLNN